MIGVSLVKIKKTHIGSYGIIIWEDRIALIRKARGGYKGKLDLPGGGIEHDENPEETLKREIMEEVGVSVDDYSLFDVTSTNITWEMDDGVFEDLHHIGVLYRVNVNDFNLKKDADGLDSLGASWYKIKDLSKEELSPFALYVVEKLNENSYL